MYLSKLTLNPRSRQANLDKANPYELHRSIMRAFPVFDHEVERVLFRLDGERLDQLLVQSTLSPDWAALQEDYLLGIPHIKSLDDFVLSSGQLLRFRLRANPSKRHPQSRKRVGLYSEQDRLEWLQRKGQQHGFSISPDHVSLHPTFWREFNLPSQEKGKKQRATFNFVDFEGLLTVENPETLNLAVRQGIGSAKGLGCGLLSLARA